tara:strand:- start:260 stop:466 length:207 start_codon:yes stop_codon:yes gene_type:complete
MVLDHSTVVHMPMAVLGAVVNVAMLVFDVVMIVCHMGVGVAGRAVAVFVSVDVMGLVVACTDVAFAHV